MSIDIRLSNIDILNDDDCACATPHPRHVGVHPMTCNKCNGVIE